MIRKNCNLTKNHFTWPISKQLLLLILDDKVSDIFVCELVWERLFYTKESDISGWRSSKLTPLYWSEKFFEAPQIISERTASVYLTRSIPREHKQNLKKILSFKGYKINELYPRRTRRATAVNWLIYWSIEFRHIIYDNNRLPTISPPPFDPAKGHYGDPDVQ